MRRSPVKIGLLLVLSILLLLPQLLVGGCKSGPPEGVEIRIGVLGGLTGPAAASVATLYDELEKTFEYMNEVEDGIDGVQLRWRMLDNQGTPEGAITAYRELRDTFDPHIYFTVEDYYLLGIMEEIEEDEAVLFTASTIQPECYTPPGRFFGLSIPISDGFAGFVTWVQDDWSGTGMPRIGVLYWGDLPTGSQWQIAQPWAMQQGVELELASYSIMAPDLQPQLLTLREAEVDYIWMLGTYGNASVAISGVTGLGMEDIPFCFNEYVESNVLIDLIGDAAEGFYVYRSETPYSDGSEAADLYTDIWQWAGEEDKWSDNRMMITLKAAITAVVRAAVEEVGWADLDSAAIYDALNSLEEIDTWGNVEGFGFGPDRRSGVSTIKIAQFTEDGTVSVSEPIVLPRTFEGVD
ncbi:MAG: ABC transporter substrate-binding protein [Dehalococcoidales bacterium]|nr:MAG: ABC transporter substrate-binding protein [Dehalococcoidales bacterium]